MRPDILNVYIGYDPRQPLAYNVLQHSIVRHASKPVSITPLILPQLPIKRRGLTDFTYSRFLVPWLSNFVGRSLFLDADMVVRGDIAELFAANDGVSAVSVMQEQPHFEWASAMMFNNGCCLQLTPEFVDDTANPLFDYKWAPSVGTLPAEFNHCVGYQQPKEAKLYHFTQGLPCFPETKGLPEDVVWDEERRALLGTVEWRELMGASVHAKAVLKRMFAKYTGQEHVLIG